MIFIDGKLFFGYHKNMSTLTVKNKKIIKKQAQKLIEQWKDLKETIEILPDPNALKAIKKFEKELELVRT